MATVPRAGLAPPGRPFGRHRAGRGSVAEPAQAPLRRIAPARSGAYRGYLTVTVVRPGGPWVPGMPETTAWVAFWRDPPDGA